MKFKATTVQEYLDEVPTERQPYFNQLHLTIHDNIPSGFEECINYGMIGWVVPHALYPAGYHCNPSLPLPFVSIASQKNFIALYHSGIYGIPNILNWFVNEYPIHCKRKLDMGKSCVRFKNMDDIPYDLIAQLMQKVSVDDCINIYSQFKK